MPQHFISNETTFAIHFFFLIFHSLVSSVSHHHLSGHDDVFEDAILEHLRDVRDDEEADNVYYSDGEYTNKHDRGYEQDSELTKDELLHVLDVIKKEANKRRERLKSESEQENNEKDESLVTATESPLPTRKKSESKKSIDIEISEAVKNNFKKETLVNLNQKRTENDQVASVEVDSSSLDRENDRIENINLREILSKKESDGTSAPPKHAHIKQQGIVSTKENKAGLDKVSFIGKNSYSFFLFIINQLFF